MEFIKKLLTKKKDAYSGMLICILLIVMVVLFAVFSTKESLLEYTSNHVGDSLNAAVMAGLNVDLVELGYNDNLIVTEEEVAGKSVSYMAFLEALKVNLDLDDEMLSNDANIIAVDADGNKTDGKGQVVVDEYHIYNVKNGEVYRLKVDTTSGSLGIPEHLGSVGTVTVDDKNHTTIQGSTVYAKISFNVDGLFAGHIRVAKEACMDLAN